MNEKTQHLLHAITEYIRPVTNPVAVKLVKGDVTRPPKAKKPMEKLGHRIAFCQGMAMARKLGWTMVLDEHDHSCPVGMIVLGHVPADKMCTGLIAYPGYAESLEAGSRMESARSVLPQGTVDEIWLAPLGTADFEPDFVVVYGNPAQVARLIQGANYNNGRGITSTQFGKTACSSYIAHPFINAECSFTVPSAGERYCGHCQDDEMIFAIPANLFEDVATGIEQVHKQGLSRYPTALYGMILEPAFPPKYQELLPDNYGK
jgi:uncharacterized protein (DUF169 family)